MPIWSEVLKEVYEAATAAKSDGAPSGGITPYDKVRRKYLMECHKHSGRNVILYASGWLQKPDADSHAVAIADDDMQALMEVIYGLKGDDLDIILHSPGGSPEAAGAMVHYLRSKFDHIRVIVPSFAMSAATMIACAADQIVMGKHSFLGPTDPQMRISDPNGGARLVPAQSILDEFDKAQTQHLATPGKIAGWLPILQQYKPGLLISCERFLELSEELVADWLAAYMFRGATNAEARAAKIARWLADNQKFKTHGRKISRDELKKRGLKVVALESNQNLQDAVLSAFHATDITFRVAPQVKIVENHRGRVFLR